MAEIKVILFDIDNTLFSTTKFAQLARDAAVRGMILKGLRANFEEARAALENIIAEMGSNFGRHFDLLVKMINGSPDPMIVAAGVKAYHDAKAILNPYAEVPQVLRELRDEGYILGIASEGIPVKQCDKLLRLGIDILFDNDKVFITSAKTVEFFEEVAKRLEKKPEECMMVGDRIDKDIIPAKMAGLHAVHIIRDRRKPRGKCECPQIRNLRELKGILV